jgi:hypothetical protein
LKKRDQNAGPQSLASRKTTLSAFSKTLMKRFIPFLLAAFCGSAAFAADSAGNPPTLAAAVDANQAVNTVCPVSGDPVGSVGKPAYAGYHGKQEVAFCCKACVKKFRKNPDKYGALAEKNQSADEGM